MRNQNKGFKLNDLHQGFNKAWPFATPYRKNCLLSLLTVLTICTVGAESKAVIIDGGDYITVDSGDLRLYNVILSLNMSAAQAIAAIETTEGDAGRSARLITSAELDTFFAEAGVHGSWATNGGWDTGSTVTNLTGSGHNVILDSIFEGMSYGFAWTDPDGSNHPSTTRDYLYFKDDSYKMYNVNGTPPGSSIGMLIVTSTVPEPSTALLLGIGLAGLGMRRRRC